MSDLKPCPFCGGMAKIIRPGNHRQSMQIGCEDCHCELECGDVVGLTSPAGYSWNFRHEERALEIQVGRLREALGGLIFAAIGVASDDSNDPLCRAILKAKDAL